MTEILTVKDLGMKLEDKVVFKDLNFTVSKDSMTALHGANGTAKTTLLRILMGVLQLTTGSFKVAQDKKVGYVAQLRNLVADYPLSMRAFVELKTPVFKNARVKARVNQILKETHLLDIQNTRMGEASGGQKQRAYL